MLCASSSSSYYILREVPWKLGREDKDGFVVSEWPAVGVEEAADKVFCPDPFVAKPLGVGHHESAGERLACGENDRACRFEKPPVLIPEGLEGNDLIPGRVRRAVGEVTKHQVDRLVWKPGHHSEAVATMKIDHAPPIATPIWPAELPELNFKRELVPLAIARPAGINRKKEPPAGTVNVWVDPPRPSSKG